MRVTVKVQGAQARERLQALRRRSTTLQPALRLIADDFLRTEQELFADSAHWAPLDPDYAARKAARGFGVRTLVMTGALEESLTAAGGRYSVREISASELLVGTRDPVAHLHQDGTGRMPARPPVDPSLQTRRRWSRMLHDWLIDRNVT